MTYAPASLQALAKLWVAEGGVNLGIVGDAAHAAKGGSYHLGKDQLAPTAYSVQTARDKAGLTEAASAIDLGRLDGTLMNLRRFSIWLVAQARANKPGTADMREIIYSPDGKIVLRWDRQRGYASAPRPGEANDSHLTHTHISWYRDAERRDHTTAFRPFFAPLPDTATEAIVKVYSVPGSFSGSWPAGTPVHAGPIGPAARTLTTERRLLVVGQDRPTRPTRYLVDGAGDAPSGEMSWLPVAGMTAKRDETFNAGVTAASSAAAASKRAG